MNKLDLKLLKLYTKFVQLIIRKISKIIAI